MHLYRVYFRHKHTDLPAETSREAQLKGAQFFKARKAYEVSVIVLGALDSEGNLIPTEHSPNELP